MELKTVTEGSEGKERTLEDFTVHGVTVPAGFLFDGASAPRIFWAIIPPFFKTKESPIYILSNFHINVLFLEL